MTDRPTTFFIAFSPESFRLLMVVLVFISFLAVEVSKVNDLLVDINIELVDLAEEGESSEKEEKKEDSQEKKEKRRAQSDIYSVQFSETLLAKVFFHQILFFPASQQEDPQPPPEV